MSEFYENDFIIEGEAEEEEVIINKIGYRRYL
jgi:hypothetical protein